MISVSNMENAIINRTFNFKAIEDPKKFIKHDTDPQYSKISIEKARKGRNQNYKK